MPEGRHSVGAEEDHRSPFLYSAASPPKQPGSEQPLLNALLMTRAGGGVAVGKAQVEEAERPPHLHAEGKELCTGEA